MKTKMITSAVQAKKTDGVRSLLFCAAYALILTFAVEMLCRKDPAAALLFAWESPAAFFYNALLVGCTLLPVLFVRRRVFGYAVCSAVWLILGIVDMITRVMRIRPFTAYDVYVFFTNLDITNTYVSLWQIALIVIAVAAIVYGLVHLFRTEPKGNVHRRLAAAFAAVLLVAAVPATIVYERNHNEYSDLLTGYNRSGFVYSFLRSFVDRGVDKPEEYDAEIIDDILADVTQAQENNAVGRRPSFVFLQMESFMDPSEFIMAECSENAVPNFTALKETCSTGYLHVPVIGCGTANVEFEVLTGMRLSDFGTGEYPYTTILQSETCETIAYELKKQGYTAHVVHNNSGTFYGRNLVLPMLGFDTFTSIEYMQNVTYNELGWSRDDVLTQSILDALDSTQGADFVYAISVQGHGKYIAEAPETPYDITSTGIEDGDKKNGFEYYVSQVQEMDAFLGELVEALKRYSEPVVLVAYGDHLPALDGLTAEDMRTGSLHKTQYVIWSSDGSIPKEDKDVTAYQLTAYTLGRLNMSGGTIMRFHQQNAGDENYDSELAALEYDILYGDKYLYDGVTPYQRTDMRMGVKDVAVTSALLREDTVIVRGENFTPFSVVYVDGKALDTFYIDQHTLTAHKGLLTRLAENAQIRVCQVDADGTVLSAAAEAELEIE